MIPDEYQELRDYVSASSKELTELIRTLCAIPAPSHMEQARAQFCYDFFKAAGAQDVYTDEALNVVCRVNYTPDVPAVIFLAHTDTVFPDTEPMPMREQEGLLYCPGAGDNTANLAVLLMCAKYYLNKASDTSVIFAANSCEEGLGNLKGIRQIMQDYKGKVSEVISFDGSIGSICDRAVGSVRYNVGVFTEGGHSFSKFGNPNAIERLSAVICDLYKLKVPDMPNTHTTYNVGTISGGTSVNTIAEHAHMLFELRSDDAKCLEIMETAFAEVISAHKRRGVKIKVELKGRRPCGGDVDKIRQQALTDRCRKLVEETTGKPCETHSGSTDCNIPLSLGVPAVCLGTYRGGGEHTRGEWIDLSSMPAGLMLALRLIGNYFRQ